MHESLEQNSKERPNHVEVLLQGGLGNQLFQLMYALTSYPSSQIVLNGQILRPRLNQLGEFEISTLQLPPNVSVKFGKRHFINKYTNIGFLLRPLISARVTRSKLSSEKNYFGLSMTWIFLCIYFRKFLMLDFEGKKHGRLNSGVIAGYFQSNISFTTLMIDSVRKILIYENPAIDTNAERKKNVLGIHIRNGDYKNNPNFGILNLLYYQRAIGIISNEIKIDIVRIFAEEKDYSKALCNFLRDKFPIEIVTKYEVASELETIQKMAECDAFIMANSTFSWWGGLLISDQTKVFFPSPWFKSNPGFEPSVSPNWRKVEALFEETI
jgi:hypothetical protein